MDDALCYVRLEKLAIAANFTRMLDKILERQLFIEELKGSRENMVAYKTREKLKELQQDDLVKVMEMRKIVLELRIKVQKDVAFSHTL
ncbi:hypothetical protein Tco_1305587 [Tanacetum coccineum]